MSDDLDALVAAGVRERGRAAASWRAVEENTRRVVSEAAAGVETAGTTIKWGGLLMVAAAILLRWTKLRTGWRAGRFLWTLAPMLARIAGPRAGGFLSHLFRRGNSEKR